MKKIFCLIALCTTLYCAEAKTIHWLTFVDTTDKNIDASGRDHGVGEMDKIGRQYLYSHFINVINSALVEKGYTVDTQDYWDTSTSPENCKKAVTDLSCDPEDIVVFYYIGHGGRPANLDDKTHPFPQMFLAQSDDIKLLPLEWVHSTLKSKGARLTITIGMCCNVKDPNMTIKSHPSFSLNTYGNAYVSGTDVKAIQRLFLETKGDLIATSASPGQSSWGGSGFGDFEQIDYYTASLVTMFNEYTANGDIEWNSFFSDLGNVVRQISLNLPARQNPIFVSNITSASEPSRQEREKPVDEVKSEPNTKENENTDDNNNTLGKYFDYIIDKDVDLAKRVDIANNLKSNKFTSNAVIKVLAQDSETVIDKESVEVFLMRISTSRLLLKVIPIDGIIADNNKISMMRVREYYRN